MTAPRVTLDTNVLVYCVQADDRRQRPALDLVELTIGGRCVLMLQSLGEFFVAATRKRCLTPNAAAGQVRRWLEVFPRPVPPSPPAVGAAISAAAAGRFAYWDALLLATAAEAGCEAVISEDMAPGATLNGIRVVPAFSGDRVSPEALALLGDRPHASL